MIGMYDVHQDEVEAGRPLEHRDGLAAGLDDASRPHRSARGQPRSRAGCGARRRPRGTSRPRWTGPPALRPVGLPDAGWSVGRGLGERISSPRRRQRRQGDGAPDSLRLPRKGPSPPGPRGRTGSLTVKVLPSPGAALDVEGAAQQADQLAADREAETGAAVQAGGGAVPLGECLEDHLRCCSSSMPMPVSLTAKNTDRPAESAAFPCPGLAGETDAARARRHAR